MEFDIAKLIGEQPAEKKSFASANRPKGWTRERDKAGESVQRWLDEACSIKRVKALELYKHYLIWARKSKVSPLSMSGFSRHLRKCPGVLDGYDGPNRTATVRNVYPHVTGEVKLMSGDCACLLRYRISGMNHTRRSLCPVHDGEPPEGLEITWENEL